MRNFKGHILAPTATLLLVSIAACQSDKEETESATVAQEAQPAAEPETQDAPIQEASAPEPGTTFKDCLDCPEMVRIPAGNFRMGDLSGSGADWEKPVRDVSISAFSAGKYEVTWAEWEACVSDAACSETISDKGMGKDNRPVINVTWEDAQAYTSWLSDKTGQSYRLLTEAEWEYVARAGSETNYPWGDEVGQDRANCSVCSSEFGLKQTAPVGTFEANSFGLYDTVGNVSEWVEDCWSFSYADHPTTGEAWTGGDCAERVARGGAWDSKPRFARSSDRGKLPFSESYFSLGFRLARDD